MPLSITVPGFVLPLSEAVSADVGIGRAWCLIDTQHQWTASKQLYYDETYLFPHMMMDKVGFFSCLYTASKAFVI
jgi:hypothetical protein